MGVETEGDKFDAGVTGRDVHLFQADLRLAITGLSGAVVGSDLRRKLRSPSGMTLFFLKLKPRNKPPDDGLPLHKSWEWIKPLPLLLVPKPIGLGGI